MPQENISSDSYLWPSNSSSSIICEGSIVDQIVDDFGVWVKVRERTTTGYNEYGDRQETHTDTMVKAYIHQWLATDDEVKEGIYKNGEITFVFKKADEDKIKTGNLIFYQNEWYKIMNIQPQIMSGKTYLLNAIVEKRIG